MRYYEYIMKFLGADHPFGDLANDIQSDFKSNGHTTPEEVEEIFEGDFSDIYDHLKDCGASTACIDTFIESWAAYRKHEKEGLKDPVPFVMVDQLRQINRNLENIGDELRKHNEHMESISGSLYTFDDDPIAETLDTIKCSLSDVVEYRKDRRGDEYALFRICGALDTYEQND